MYENWIFAGEVSDIKSYDLSNLNDLLFVFNDVVINRDGIMLLLCSNKYVWINSRFVKFNWINKCYPFEALHIMYDDEEIQFVIHELDSELNFYVDIYPDDD